MGHHTAAAGYAEATQTMGLSIDLALEMHLTSNHYPAIPTAWVEAAKAAIAACDDGEPSMDLDINAAVAETGMIPRDSHPVTGPDGVQRIHTTAGDLASCLHLEAFITDPFEPPYDEADDEADDEGIIE